MQDIIESILDQRVPEISTALIAVATKELELTFSDDRDLSWLSVQVRRAFALAPFHADEGPAARTSDGLRKLQAKLELVDAEPRSLEPDERGELGMLSGPILLCPLLVAAVPLLELVWA